MLTTNDIRNLQYNEPSKCVNIDKAFKAGYVV